MVQAVLYLLVLMVEVVLAALGLLVDSARVVGPAVTRVLGAACAGVTYLVQGVFSVSIIMCGNLIQLDVLSLTAAQLLDGYVSLGVADS